MLRALSNSWAKDGEPSSKAGEGMLGRGIDWGLALIVVLAPTQFALNIKGIRLAPVDLVVWGVCALWLASNLSKFQRVRVFWPSPAMLLFPALAALSIVKAGNRFEACKDIFQYIEYFGAAAILFHNGIRDREFMGRLVDLFLIVGSLVVAYGLVQYFTPGVETFKVRATFGNRNILGGYLTLLVPLAYGRLLWDSWTSIRIWMATLVAAAAILALSGGVWLGLFLGLGMISAWRGQRALIAFLVLFTLVSVFLLPRLPRANLDEIQTSVAIFDDEGEMQPRYTEWQAAWNMWRDNPLLGVGAGNYQANIGRYYGYIPRVNRNVTEPDSHNLHLVLLSSTGLCGLAAFLGMLIFYMRNAALAYGMAANPATKGLAAGLVGAIAAFAVNGVWTGLLVRGLGIPLVFCLVLTVIQMRFNSVDGNHLPETSAR